MSIGLLAILLAMQTAPAQQQRNDRRTWYQAYADAQRYVQQSNWTAAIADLEAASRLGAPKPGRNILFYGDVYRDFNPDYYFGIAYLNLNRYDDAERAFERVRQMQLIAPRDSLYAEFTRQATAVKAALEKQASSQLAAADTPQGAPPPIDPTTPQAPYQPPPTEQSPIQQPSPQAPTQPPSTEQPIAPQPTIAQPPVQQGPIQRAPIRPTPQNAAIQSKTPVTAAEERSALVDFFSGQYEAAAAKLSALAGRPNASPRAYFYLACSHVAMALTGKADAVTAVVEARTQLALAGDTGQFAADRALISPRIAQALGIRP